MAPLRVYVDTSVIGGCLDEEFAEDSNRLMQAAKDGRVILLVSEMVFRELASAPPSVQQVLNDIPTENLEEVPLTKEVEALTTSYIAAGIVGPKWEDDATHVAAATVAKADAIVSWNFKHIVRLDRMIWYNAINKQSNYGELTIVSPTMMRLDNADQDDKDRV